MEKKLVLKKKVESYDCKICRFYNKNEKGEYVCDIYYPIPKIDCKGKIFEK